MGPHRLLRADTGDLCLGTESNVTQKERASENWSLSQCYFAVMGGIVIETGDYIANESHLSITAEGVRLLSFLDKLPSIDNGEVRDKSKADGLAKLLVLLQAGWMIIQCIGRVAQDLPVTLLEINTIGHVICAFALYMLWWSKPLDIKDPHRIVGEHGLDKYIALMYMCSPISGNKGDEISEIRCLAYTLPENRAKSTTTPSPDSKALGSSVPKFHSTRFSLGSIGARNPLKFLGPLQKVQDVHGEVQYTYKCDKVAAEHEEFFLLQGPSHCLHHAKRRWSLANDVVQKLWDECEKRKEYTKVFFTWSTLGVFVGEPIYIADHVPNFPGFSYLGSVNVQRDILKTVVAFAGAAYGGLHLSAWNDYFPTQVERIMWIACACATGLTGLVLALFFLATNKFQQLEAAENRMRNNKTFKSFLKGVLVPLFLAARVYIIVEAFICLRRQPEAVYKTPEWSSYIPHL
ncbi:hypothetical protein E8E12_004327 [Didymella heteroderae]|uniref:Uncharacterized protein n=1 Tax=Didymella heteroderae TaxID=1769908 RepID=A0A9P4WU41_9PLEO|nr:hypothetical protein E8E12_004327 [Didymella heteroderae]